MVLTIGSLFSGIGGFELGLEHTGGFKTLWQCEKDAFCLKVLAKHWPDVKRFTDIKEMKEDIPYVDVICGGFPCQPVSCAGKRKGAQDERWLWPEFYRIVCQVKPRWVLVENVPGLLSADSGRLFAGILRDLSSSGYDAEWNIVSAAGVGAPHLRKRVFIMAYSDRQPSEIPIRNVGREQALVETERGEQELGCAGDTSREIADSKSIRCGGGQIISEAARKRWGICAEGDNSWSTEPDVGRVANGVPARVDRLRALGNAIVPQCAEFVGRCILEAEARP